MPVKTSEPLPLAVSRGGHALLIRSLQPEDAAIYHHFFNRLSPETVRCRYGYMISAMTGENAERLVTVDPAEQIALGVFTADQETLHAVGRCYLERAAGSAEVAIVVAEEMRRLGLARLLLNLLSRLAAGQGIRELHAFVATTDAPVLRLLKSAGFSTNGCDDGGDVKLTRYIQP